VTPKIDSGTSSRMWTRRFFIALTVLAWCGILAVALVVLRVIAEPILYLAISALIALVLYPLVSALQRYLPRALSITVVPLDLAAALLVLFVAVVASLIHQLSPVVTRVTSLLQPANQQKIQPLIDFVQWAGIAPGVIQPSAQHLLAPLQGRADDAGRRRRRHLLRGYHRPSARYAHGLLPGERAAHLPLAASEGTPLSGGRQSTCIWIWRMPSWATSSARAFCWAF
jgi:hypothetical protein